MNFIEPDPETKSPAMRDELAERLRSADVAWDDRPEPAGTYHEWLANVARAWAREQVPSEIPFGGLETKPRSYRDGWNECRDEILSRFAPPEVAP